MLMLNYLKTRKIVLILNYQFIFVLLLFSINSPTLFTNAQTPYESGYDHGCDDAKISDPNKRYIEQDEKGSAFHTSEFMKGYYNGFDACSKDSGTTPKSMSSGACYDQGREDGLNNPFNADTNSKCKDFEDEPEDTPYYAGFIDGCMRASEENTQEECESWTD